MVNTMRTALLEKPMNVVAIDKGQEKYLFFYDDEGREECLRQLGIMASDQELSFTWYDCALLSQRVRSLANKGGPA